MKKNSNYNETIRMENEITRLKLQAEFGLELSGGNKELNPEMEKIWLNNIMEFEKAAMNKQVIKVGDKIGNPVLIPLKELAEENISVELQKLMDMLREKKIIIETLYETSDKELYRFITEELLLEEMNSIDIPNMFTFFIYEEYHPNHEAEIKKVSADFMKFLVMKEDDFLGRVLYAGTGEEKEVQMQNLKRKLTLFRDAYDELRLDEFKIATLIIGEKDAEVRFEFKLGVLPPGSRTFHILSAPGKFKLINEYGLWEIEEIQMSGVV